MRIKPIHNEKDYDDALDRCLLSVSTVITSIESGNFPLGKLFVPRICCVF